MAKIPEGHVGKGESWEGDGEGRPREQPDPGIRSAGVQIAFVWSGIKSGHTRKGWGGRWRGLWSGTADGLRTRSTPSLRERPIPEWGVPTFKDPGAALIPHPATPAALNARDGPDPSSSLWDPPVFESWVYPAAWEDLGVCVLVGRPATNAPLPLLDTVSALWLQPRPEMPMTGK